MTELVPTIDIAAWPTAGSVARRSLAADVDEANRSVGFLKIAGHGVPASLLERFQDVTTAFFERPIDEKLALASPDPAVDRGYAPLGSEALSYSVGVETMPDLFEAFNAGIEPPVAGDPYYESERHRLFAANIWPDEPAGLRTTWLEYMGEVGALSQRLLEIFATALGLDPQFFASRAGRSPDVLRANHYVRQPGAPDPLPGQMRMGAHTDYGTCTVLLADDVPGLQIVGPAGDWVDVRPSAGTFLVNLGDLLAAWTNDAWRSTLHRVVPPPRRAGGPNRRRSYAYFHEADHDVTVTPLGDTVGDTGPARYPPFNVGDHLTGKVVGPRSLRPSDAISTTAGRDGALTA